MDLLQAFPPRLPLLIPSTVIRETRHRSLPLYNRLQQLIQDEERCVWVWWNEERRETATATAQSNPGGQDAPETPNDRNDRAIRQTVLFYQTHLLASTREAPTLVLLSDDRGNRELAKREGIEAASAREWVDGMKEEERAGLVDLVVGGVDEAGPSERRGRRLYDEVGLWWVGARMGLIAAVPTPGRAYSRPQVRQVRTRVLQC